MTDQPELKMPKKSLRIVSDTGEIIAEGGWWKRVPNDGEFLIAFYGEPGKELPNGILEKLTRLRKVP